MTDHDYLFERVFEIMAYDYTPISIRTINIHLVYGTTPIFDINNYSKDIEPDPPPHTFDQTLIYSILDNTSSEPTICTLESAPPDKTVNVCVKLMVEPIVASPATRISYIFIKTLHHFI